MVFTKVKVAAYVVAARQHKIPNVTKLSLNAPNKYLYLLFIALPPVSK